jgi:ABC-2 type transport system permease protein
MALRLRLAMACLTAFGMAVVIIMVGALFPSVGGTIGKLNVPKGVANLLGGANYGTIAGWMRSEIGAVYGPLVIAATAIVGAVALTAGEEDSGVLGLVLAHPIERARLVVAKAAAVAVTVMIVAGGTWLGLIIGVAAAGGGISVADQAALALQLAFFGLAIGAVAFALASVTGRKDVALGGSGAFAVTAFLINGFAPLVAGVEWLKYLSPFYYYSGHDPIANGVDIGGLVVLALATITLTAVAVAGFRRRDLRT